MQMFVQNYSKNLRIPIIYCIFGRRFGYANSPKDTFAQSREYTFPRLWDFIRHELNAAMKSAEK